MKITIISDIHDNIPNLEKCLQWCNDNKVDEIICCGDVANAETMKYLSENFKNNIHIIRGNADIYYEEELEHYKNYIDYGRYGAFEIGGVKIGLCHEPVYLKQTLDICHCDIIFYGHTHKPDIKRSGKTQYVNPGTLSGMFQGATFACWEIETGSLELKMLNIL
jgi:putative phosphoesterase